MTSEVIIVLAVLCAFAMLWSALLLFLNWWNQPHRAIRREDRAIAREDAAIRRENVRILKGEW